MLLISVKSFIDLIQLFHITFKLGYNFDINKIFYKTFRLDLIQLIQLFHITFKLAYRKSFLISIKSFIGFNINKRFD